MQTLTRVSARQGGRLRHSRDALAHSVSAATWRRTFDTRSADATLAISARVGAAAALVLVLFGLSGHTDLAGVAVLGALCAAFSRYEPLRRTAEKVGFVGVLVVVSVLAGGLVGLAAPPGWVQIGLLAVLAGVAAAVMAAFRIAGPGPVVLVFGATAAVGSVSDPVDLGRVTLAVAVGAGIGLVTALTPFTVLPWGPARLAVARALAAVAAVRGGGDRAAADAALAAAREKVALTAASDDVPVRDLTAILDEAEVALVHWDAGERGRLDDIVRHECELRKVKRHRVILASPGGVAARARPQSFVAAGAAGLRRIDVSAYAARIVLAAAIAGWVAAAVGLEHPLWASMGAVAAMQGVTYGQTVQRAIQRLVGNVAGALVAAGLLALTFGYWQAVLVIVLLQFGAEITASRNYALCSLFVTPMALLVVGLGLPVGPEIGVSRVLDTLVGVVVGVVVAAATVSASDRAHLPA